MPQEKFIPESESKYNEAKIALTKVLEDPKLGLDEKVESLEHLADQMGMNPHNIQDFNDIVLERWVKGLYPEVYKEYKQRLLQEQAA